jgi:hypothetical protein
VGSPASAVERIRRLGLGSVDHGAKFWFDHVPLAVVEKPQATFE